MLRLYGFLYDYKKFLFNLILNENKCTLYIITMNISIFNSFNLIRLA